MPPTRAISIIHKHALHGVAVTVDPAVWKRVTRTHPVARLKGTPYEFCTWNCILMIAMWARENRTGNKNQISYIFESGDGHQPEANAMMNFAFSHAHIRDFCMYAGHGFFPKERNHPMSIRRLVCLAVVHRLPTARQRQVLTTKKGSSQPYRRRRGSQGRACR